MTAINHLKMCGYVALVAGGMALAGCTTPAATPATSAPTTTASPNGSTTTIPYNPKLNAKSDVTTTGPCTYANGAWQLEGSVRNSGNTPRSYQIVVDFKTTPGNALVETEIVNVSSVASGATASWATAGGQGKKDVRCDIRQVQAL